MTQTASIGAIQRADDSRVEEAVFANLSGFDTSPAFTVDGDVMVQVFGIVGATPITCTSGTTVISVGTTEAAQAIIANTTIDNAQFAATDVWVDTTPTVDCEAMSTSWFIVADTDIILTRSVDDLTAGNLKLYCIWKPLSSGATVVAAS